MSKSKSKSDTSLPYDEDGLSAAGYHGAGFLLLDQPGDAPKLPPALVEKLEGVVEQACHTVLHEAAQADPSLVTMHPWIRVIPR